MKLMKALVVMALVLFMAAPAFAEFKLNGYYRLQGTTWDTDAAAAGKDDTTAITQRLRMKMTNSLNDNVGFVYYGEVDLDWGVNGDIGIDDKNLETKNAYLYIKDEGMNITLGGQGFTDIFSGLVISEDIMAVNANFNLGAADLGLLYGKLSEGTADVDDDRDFYAATVSFAATDAVKLSAGVYVDDKGAVAGSDASATLVYNAAASDPDFPFDVKDIAAVADKAEATNVYYGLRADAKVSDNLSISGFGLIADMENGDTYVLDASAQLKLANGSLLFEVLYAPEEDDAADRFADTADFFYNGQNSIFLLRDVAATNNGYSEGKYRLALDQGAGLTMFLLSGNFDFDAFYAGFGIGYADTDEEELGTEVGVKIGKKFFGNVDVSLRAAMWDAGDTGLTYTDSTGTTLYADEDETKIIGMVNVGF